MVLTYVKLISCRGCYLVKKKICKLSRGRIYECSKYSSGFPQSVIVLELKLIAVELMQEEAVIDMMWSYRAAPCVALNLYYILFYLIMKEVELDTLTSYNTDTREGQSGNTCWHVRPY
jgi:hypothetical protein